MLGIEQLLASDISDIKKYIEENDPIFLESLKDIRMKKKIIDISDNNIFVDIFLRSLKKEQALNLFDDIGIEILKNTNNRKTKINCIINSNKHYLTELLKSHNFCDLFIKEMPKLTKPLENIEPSILMNLINYAKDDSDKLVTVISHLPIKIQSEVIKNSEFDYEVKTKLLPKLSRSSIEYILRQHTLDLNAYTYNDLYNICSKKISIPPLTLEEPNFLKKISTIESVKDFRFLINEFNFNNDVSELEKARKKFYELELMTYNNEHEMLARYYNCYKDISMLINQNLEDYTLVDESIAKNFNFFGSGNDELFFKIKLSEYLFEKDKEGLKKFLQKESNLQLSNIIIDYHFEEVPYNFLLDVKQLYKFQSQEEATTISEEDLKIYERLLNIDDISYKEKLKLHQELLKTNWIEKNYDIFRKSKNKAVKLIKEQMLNEETIQKYYDDDLSKKHDVPIYVLNGDNFKAFIKSLSDDKNKPITKEDITYEVDGSSYSLDGSEKLNIYRNPQKNYALIFSDFPENQVVHMCSTDSFSYYVHTSPTRATTNVNEILTPKELIENSIKYNEIVLSQKNTTRVDDELNEKLALPTPMGIYCYDEITPNDIESAKNLGIGIVVVNTKAYTKEDIDYNNFYIGVMDEIAKNKQEYLSGLGKDDMTQRRRK